MSYLFSITEEAVHVATTDIVAVFTHWKTHHPKSFPRVHSGLPEWKKVRERLADGYQVDDLKQAIDGMHVTPHNLGVNERQRKYLSLELCMRDAKHVEMYRESLEEHKRRLAGEAPVISERTHRTVQAGESWLARKQAEANTIEGEVRDQQRPRGIH